MRMMAESHEAITMCIRFSNDATNLSPSEKADEAGSPPIVRLWMLRCLVLLHGSRQLVNDGFFASDRVAKAVGLEDWIERQGGEFDRNRVIKQLRSLHRQAERTRARCSWPAVLRRNVRRLAELIGMSEVEQTVLAFVIVLHGDEDLANATGYLGNLSLQQLYAAVSCILGLAECDVRNALSGRGVLARSGMVTVDRNYVSDLKERLDAISGNFVGTMLGDVADPVELLRGKVDVASGPVLGLADYPHLGTSLAILRPYLRKAVRERVAGVNVFLHGPLGTGKSQLARVLAADIGCELFEVACADGDDDPLSADDRLRAVRAGQCFFASRGVMIVFDESEDVFNDGGSIRHSTAKSHKAWMNRLLEGNAVPTLWLSNQVEGMDPAFIRRFDMVVEVPVPPREQRERIVRALCADAVDDAIVRRLAKEEKLAPAVVARARGVMRQLDPALPTEQAGKVLLHLVDSTLAAQGHARMGQVDMQELPDIYDLEFIHADVDLAAIAARFQAVRSARLCLYGPPGTGKTAFGRWLAEQLGMPLRVKRASDLMSPFVGENEQNIAKAFRSATRDGALLLIDEVDSFLQDRQGASRNWEATLVNEMLTQMESFQGVFVASTNLMAGLDQAALRRFDLKVKFDYLRPAQTAALLRRHAERLGLAVPADVESLAGRQLGHVTPGDFAAVMRQQRFRPSACFADFVTALRDELAHKAVCKPGIGFVH